MGTVRRQVRLARSADDVWAVVGDPVTIHQWFPGIVDAKVDGTTRVITTASGLPMPEEIVTNDAIQRRFQYRLTGGIVRNHLGTIDVFDLGDGTQPRFLRHRLRTRRDGAHDRRRDRQRALELKRQLEHHHAQPEVTQE